MRHTSLKINRHIGRTASVFFGLATCLVSAPSDAFKIDPWSYRPFGASPRGIEAQLESFLHNPRMLLLGPIAMGVRVPAAMGQLKEAVHENLTDLSIRCARGPLARGGLKTRNFSGDDMILRCAGRSGELQSRASDLGEDAEDLIRAVRFNDAPPVKTARALMTLVTPSAMVCGEVRVPENAACWALLMAHAGGLAANDPGNREFRQGGNFLFRSHYGDMQYLHAMASRGETLAQGHARILLWAKFAYQVASGEIAADAKIGTLPEFGSILNGFEAVSVAQFFETRDNVTPERVRRLALGALLHTVQDSFAEGHAGRDLIDGAHFGPIHSLRDFTCQDSGKHGTADRAAHYPWFNAATHGARSPVTLGAQLIDLIARDVQWGAPVGSTSGAPDVTPGAHSVARFMHEAVFPMVSAKAGLTASAGRGFLRSREPQSAARSGLDAWTAALTADAPGAVNPGGAGGAADCKE